MGAVLLEVHPGPLNPAQFRPQDVKVVEGISHCSNLPEHVAQRQADSASQILDEAGIESRVCPQVLHLPSTGSGITLWSEYRGGSALGERGIRAEEVGKTAADEIILEIRSLAAVDRHLADQLIPYLLWLEAVIQPEMYQCTQRRISGLPDISPKKISRYLEKRPL